MTTAYKKFQQVFAILFFHIQQQKKSSSNRPLQPSFLCVSVPASRLTFFLALRSHINISFLEFLSLRMYDHILLPSRMQGFRRSYEANRSMHDSQRARVCVAEQKQSQYTLIHNTTRYDTTQYDWIHLHGKSIVFVCVCVRIRLFVCVSTICVVMYCLIHCEYTQAHIVRQEQQQFTNFHRHRHLNKKYGSVNLIFLIILI